MAKKGIAQNIINKGEKAVGSVFTGVGKFVKNIIPKMTKRNHHKTHGGKKSSKSRKSRKSSKCSNGFFW
jgi:hypothetical protein